MRFAVSLFVIAVGAILVFGVTDSPDDSVRVHVIGLILIVTGLVGLAMACQLFVSRRRTDIIYREDGATWLEPNAPPASEPWEPVERRVLGPLPERYVPTVHVPGPRRHKPSAWRVCTGSWTWSQGRRSSDGWRSCTTSEAVTSLCRSVGSGPATSNVAGPSPDRVITVAASMLSMFIPRCTVPAGILIESARPYLLLACRGRARRAGPTSSAALIAGWLTPRFHDATGSAVRKQPPRLRWPSRDAEAPGEARPELDCVGDHGFTRRIPTPPGGYRGWAWRPPAEVSLLERDGDLYANTAATDLYLDRGKST